MNLENKKVAIVCDRIKDFWGAEIVLEQFLEIFPRAHIYSSVFFADKNKIFSNKKITTSFIQKIPFLNKSHKLALFLRPLAFESFDLSEYDIVISSSSAESKWVITKVDSLHICYCHTPTRYFWSHYHKYINMMEFGILNPIWRWLMPKIIYKLRQRDFIAAQRPDFFIANSINTKNRIKKYYKRNSSVIYPCLDIKNIEFSDKKEDYYFYTWRVIPYKKFDLVVEAFNKNKKKIIIAVNTKWNLYKKLKSISKENIIWKENLSIKEINKLHLKAKAFLFPPEEDFWLAPIAAMASWTPVIAYKKWWALETIIDKKVWVFFDKQDTKSLNKAIEEFENMKFNYKEIRKHSLKFDKENFKKEILEFIKGKIASSI